MNSMIKKRNALVIMLLMLTCGMVKAQEESPVGKFSAIPRLGVTIANLSGNKIVASGGDLDSKNKVGFLGGVDVEYRVSKDLAVGLGVYSAQQGFRYPDFSTPSPKNDVPTSVGYHDYHVNLHFLNVPLYVKGYLFDGFAVMTGLQAGFFINSKESFEATEMTSNKDGSTTYGETKPYSGDYDCKKMDWSIPVGISYEYMNVILDARYHFGLTNISKTDESMKNKAFTVTVGYRFPL